MIRSAKCAPCRDFWGQPRQTHHVEALGKAGYRHAQSHPHRHLEGSAALAAVITVGACSGSPHVRSITLTFIRHAESQSNAQHVINTDIPGPGLTEEGQGQAEQLAHQLSRNNFDGIYASDMVRTQETAAPLAHALGKSVEILPGLREIDAGRYNNRRPKGLT